MRVSIVKAHIFRSRTDQQWRCEEKVAAIRDARPPKDTSEVRSFMGLVQYSAKFMSDVASVAKPNQELARKGVTFKWGEEKLTAFQ